MPYTSCPLVDYLTDNKEINISVDMALEMFEGYHTSNLDKQYGYALFLYEITHNKEIFPEGAELPLVLKNELDNRSADIMISLSSRQYAEAALMAAMFLVEGIGVAKNPESAAIYLEQAESKISKSDPRVNKLREYLDALGVEIKNNRTRETNMVSGIFNDGSSASDELKISKVDIAAFISPMGAPVDDINSKYLSSALSELLFWIEDGFKYEDDKGTMYWSLVKSLDSLIDTVKSSPDTDDHIMVPSKVFEIMKYCYAQIGEAALQVGGVSPEKRNIFLPNFGFGHAPEEDKHMGDLLRNVRDEMTLFFEKYGIEEAADHEVDYLGKPFERPSKINPPTNGLN